MYGLPEIVVVVRVGVCVFNPTPLSVKNIFPLLLAAMTTRL